MRLLRVLPTVAAVAAGLWAQTADKPLTNSDIESMLAAGLPEGTILMKIQDAAFRGLVDLDASTTALIALKQKGATEQTLNAVMWAEPFGAGLKQTREDQRLAPGLPRSGGVYYRAPAGYVMLRSFLLWPPFYSGWDLYSRRSRAYDVPLAGSHADLQVTEPQPAFYLREAAPGPWRIIRVAPRDDRRLLPIVSGAGFAPMDQFPAGETRDVQIMQMTRDIFTLRPAAPLESGEYVLCKPVPGGFSVNVCHAFGVTR